MTSLTHRVLQRALHEEHGRKRQPTGLASKAAHNQARYALNLAIEAAGDDLPHLSAFDLLRIAADILEGKNK